MARLEFFLVAEDISIDQTTNRLSLFNVFESIGPPSVPIIVAKCCAVALWHREPEDEGRDLQSVLVITEPSGQSHRIETNFRMANPRHRIMNRVRGLPIMAAGQLRFELLLNGQHVAFHDVAVVVQPPPEAAAVH